ncbi:MAG: c-type cytochrome domain-containing protein, partial [Planctomycetota bacterium]
MYAHFKAALLALALLVPATFAAQPPIDVVATNRATPVDFDADILPLLKTSCISCHNKTTTKGELNVETPDLIRRGGESGPGIKPGKGLGSLLVRVAAHHEEPHMPPKDNKVKAPNLAPAQLGLLRQWIDEGAKASASSEHKIAWEPVPDSFSGIYAAALTRDGHYAACSRGGQIFIYHIPTRKLVAQLTDDSLASKSPAPKNGIAHRDSIPSLAFSPDGKRLASGSFREIKIWLHDDAITSQQLPADAARKTELAAKAPPSSGTFEFDVPATKQKLTVAKDGAITLWDAEKKTKVRELKHGAEINAAAASINTDRIATSGVTNTVKIWDVANGVMIAEIKGERAATDAATEAARKSDFLTSETAYRKSDITSGEADLKKVEDRIKKINEDTKTAQTNVEAKIKLRDEAAKVKADTEKATPVPANFDVPDEATQKIRTDAATKLADVVKKFTEAESLVVRAKDSVTNLQNDLKNATEQIVKQTKAIADAKAAAQAAEQLQKAAEADAKKVLEAANAQQKGVRALVFSPDGSQLATAADDGRLHVWSAIDGTALRTLPGCGPTPTSLRTLTWDASGITATA